MSDNNFGVKKLLGFGAMRPPMNGDVVDYEQFAEMVDHFMENGFNYFDTASVYLNGESENALKKCLTSRYPRDQYILTNKCSGSLFSKEEDLEDMFNKQLERCGVEYFDFYLMHAQGSKNFQKYKDCKAYEFAFRKKKEGKIKHVGFSFHDTAEVLEQILIEYPEIEVVQIQFNYLDFLDRSVQSKKCYEVCRKYNKPVLVMEPVKGGTLVKLPEEAKKVYDELGELSYASYAIRFAAGFDGMLCILSGMSNLEQMKDNVSYMKDFKPLSKEEMDAVNKVVDIYTSNENLIKCTGCRYCVDGCPKKINIPDLFTCYNQNVMFDGGYWGYKGITSNGAKPSDCIKCGKCEKECPQKLPIRELLEKVEATFEKKEK
ncbi:MAG: 4Fe-4S dicluster domain-containing protein [Erysipelotrichaceae bacterium]|nr:4Fe-4S dicluster domain-containing protein [Erysipelotrichaceae bacterium]